MNDSINVDENEIEVVPAIDDSALEEVLKSNPIRVYVIDFWAPWCGPCRVMGPMMEELASRWEGKVDFYKMNVDENPLIASKYNVRAIPTLLILRGKEVQDQIVGIISIKDISNRIDKVLANGYTM